VHGAILVILALALGTAPSTRAQSPRPAGFGPTIEASAGYTYLNLSVPSVGRANLNGFDTTLTTNLTERFGICGDFSYAQASRTLSYDKASSVTTLTGGPVIYLVRKKNYSLYAHTVFGGARVETTVPIQARLLSGYVARFAFAAGGGVQYHYSPSISFQLGADYLHTQFAQSETSFQGQNNLRAVVSFVYHFSSQRK
jgi:opacity protein-like surface antigen